MSRRAKSVRRFEKILGVLLLFFFQACSSNKTQPLDLGVIVLQADAGWRSTAPTSRMRQAQFALPRVKNDPEDAELVVFYFGADQGGSVESNLRRWYGQFSQPDSSASEEKAKVAREVVDEMNLAIVDLSGTYVAPIMPGNAEQYNKPNFRMLAAVLETSQGPYFFKLVGPEQTVAHWETSFKKFMKSAKQK
jgi:hypothetical protein